MNLALTDDLQRLLRRKVEDGQFPNEAAVVREALRIYLSSELQEGPPPGGAAQSQGRRTPGPFLEDDMALPPLTLPRPGPEVACACKDDAARRPDRFPGE